MPVRIAASLALLLVTAPFIAGCSCGARSFERDASTPIDEAVDAPAFDLFTPPPPPLLCEAPRAIPIGAACESMSPSLFAGCTGAAGAVFDGMRCVDVRGCPDVDAPFANRSECAMSCAAVGECNTEFVRFSSPLECCVVCDAFWTEALDDADVASLCATLGFVRCDADLYSGTTGELCVAQGYSGREALVRGCAWSLLSTVPMGCHVWL